MYDKLITQIVCASTLLFVAFGFFIIYFIIRYKNREQQHEIEKQLLLFELEKKELNLGFKERELILDEISEDIHDNIGQVAFLIRRNLYTIEQLCTGAEQRNLIGYVTFLTDRIINDTRYVGHSLNSDYIKTQGLCRMLEDEIERLNSSGQITCNIRISGNDRCISPEAQLLVYRIAQEAIHNALQHASATNLEMQLVYNQENFTMRITDDGVGFDEAIVQENGTMGITNMHKRAKVLNGRLEIVTAPGKGCDVILYCPVNTNTIKMP